MYSVVSHCYTYLSWLWLTYVTVMDLIIKNNFRYSLLQHFHKSNHWLQVFRNSWCLKWRSLLKLSIRFKQKKKIPSVASLSGHISSENSLRMEGVGTPLYCGYQGPARACVWLWLPSTGRSWLPTAISPQPCPNSTHYYFRSTLHPHQT